MARNVTSYDPRKKPIVDALKKKSGGTKVTLLKEIGPGVFEGSCLKGGGPATDMGAYSWIELGKFQVTAAEAGLMGDETPAVRTRKRCGNRYTGASLEL
jgi:hypothetical protein